MADRIQLRRGAYTQWANNLTEVLSDGEIGIVKDANNTYMIIGDGVNTVDYLIGVTTGARFQIPIFKVNSDIIDSDISENYEESSITFSPTNELLRLDTNKQYSSYSNIYTYYEKYPDNYYDIEMEHENYTNSTDSLLNINFNSGMGNGGEIKTRLGNISIESYLNSSCDVYNNNLGLYGRAATSGSANIENGTVEAYYEISVSNNAGYTGLQMDTVTGCRIEDGLFQIGLGDASDYSVNKGPNSYITPNWLRSLSGYNEIETQMLVNSTGTLIWQTIV